MSAVAENYTVRLKDQYETDIRTTPEKLWAALTNGEITRRYWFDRRIESDWKPGSPVQVTDVPWMIVEADGTGVKEASLYPSDEELTAARLEYAQKVKVHMGIFR